MRVLTLIVAQQVRHREIEAKQPQDRVPPQSPWVFLNLCCCVIPLAESCCGLFWRKVGALMPYESKNRMGTGGWYSGSGGGKAGRRLGGFRRFAWIGAMSDVRPGIHIALRLVCSPAAGPAQPRVDRRAEAQAGAMAMPQSSV